MYEWRFPMVIKCNDRLVRIKSPLKKKFKRNTTPAFTRFIIVVDVHVIKRGKSMIYFLNEFLEYFDVCLNQILKCKKIMVPYSIIFILFATRKDRAYTHRTVIFFNIYQTKKKPTWSSQNHDNPNPWGRGYWVVVCIQPLTRTSSWQFMVFKKYFCCAKKCACLVINCTLKLAEKCAFKIHSPIDSRIFTLFTANGVRKKVFKKVIWGLQWGQVKLLNKNH